MNLLAWQAQGQLQEKRLYINPFGPSSKKLKCLNTQTFL
jgi:hypothetical protein